MKRGRDSAAGANWSDFRKKHRLADGSALANAAISFTASWPPAPKSTAAVPPVPGNANTGHAAGAMPTTSKVVQPARAATSAADSAKDDALRVLLGPWEPSSLTTGAAASIIALDCEMVGVGRDGSRSALAQVVVVDWAGKCIYNHYVRPGEAVTDFRTAVSGILPKHMVSARPFLDIQREVAEVIKGKLLVGHALRNDLRALLLNHPWTSTRDTATYRPFCRVAGRGGGAKLRSRRLAHLVEEHLGVTIQGGQHDPAEDARAALALYKLRRREWELTLLPGAKPGKSKATDARAQSVHRKAPSSLAVRLEAPR